MFNEEETLASDRLISELRHHRELIINKNVLSGLHLKTEALIATHLVFQKAAYGEELLSELSFAAAATLTKNPQGFMLHDITGVAHIMATLFNSDKKQQSADIEIFPLD